MESMTIDAHDVSAKRRPYTAVRESQWHGTIDVPLHVHHEYAAEISAPCPIVLLHGGGGQATDFITTPDGRPGWVQLLVERGWDVYAVDRPGFGRSPWRPALGDQRPSITPERLRFVFTPSAAAGGDPHDQWPTVTGDEDAIFLSMAKGSTGLAADLAHYQAAERSVIADFVKSLGRCILVAHSAGGAAGFQVADAVPDALDLLIEIEPTSPPFSDFMGPGALAWGLTAAPVAYDPPVAHAEELRLERQAPVGGFPPGALQAEPARRLANISRVPIIVVTSETSGARFLDPQSVAFLRQAGCDVDHLLLSQAGVSGNGHAMMLERNNEAVLDALLARVAEHPALSGAKP